MVSQEHFTRTRRETMMMIAFFVPFLRVTYSGGLTAISVDVTNADVPVSLKEGEREHLMIEKNCCFDCGVEIIQRRHNRV